MTKAEFKEKVKVLSMTQKEFFDFVGIKNNSNNYKDEEDMPRYYDAIITLLEENRELKNNLEELKRLVQIRMSLEDKQGA
jgi:hypothetical protein